MSAGITIDLSELVALDGRLEAAYARSKNLSPLMDAIGMAMETSTEERFDNEASPDGLPWKKSIRAREEGGKTLTDSARLRGSITHAASADQVEIGSNLIYAGIHQVGGRITAKSGHLKFALPGGLGFVSVKGVNIPARPYLGIGGDDEQTIVELSADYLLEDLAA